MLVIQIEGTSEFFAPKANRLSPLQGHTFAFIHKTTYFRRLLKQRAEADSLERNELIARHV